MSIVVQVTFSGFTAVDQNARSILIDGIKDILAQILDMRCDGLIISHVFQDSEDITSPRDTPSVSFGDLPFGHSLTQGQKRMLKKNIIGTLKTLGSEESVSAFPGFRSLGGLPEPVIVW